MFTAESMMKLCLNIDPLKWFYGNFGEDIYLFTE